MIVMVTGSRDWRDINTIAHTLREVDEKSDDLPTLLNGCASGADAIARAWAESFGWHIEDFWPDYVELSFREANLQRNKLMVDYKPTVIFAYPTARSRGTWHAVNYAKQRGYEEGCNLFVYTEVSEV